MEYKNCEVVIVLATPESERVVIKLEIILLEETIKLIESILDNELHELTFLAFRSL